jgi:hypothetical protein
VTPVIVAALTQAVPSQVWTVAPLRYAAITPHPAPEPPPTLTPEIALLLKLHSIHSLAPLLVAVMVDPDASVILDCDAADSPVYMLDWL